MQRFHVILSKAALADLQRIHGTIEADSPLNADAFIGKLLDRAFSLEEAPLAHRAVGRSRSTGLVVRVTHEGSYLIYYRASDTPPQVVVLEFRHGARRQPRRFG